MALQTDLSGWANAGLIEDQPGPMVWYYWSYWSYLVLKK